MSLFKEGKDLIDIRGVLPQAHPELREYRPLRAITQIVVHYDEVWAPEKYDPIERYKGQARYHIGKNWGSNGEYIPGFGLMYHYRVNRRGEVFWTQPLEVITWHARAANYSGLAVACDLGGNQEPSEEQLQGLHNLLEWLCYHRPDFPATRKDVWGHCEVKTNATACPGRLLSWVQRFRKGGW